MRLANGIVLEKEATFGELKFSALRREVRIILSNMFSFGMLIMCITQALLYGKKHMPARISVVLGIVFVMLTILKL